MNKKKLNLIIVSLWPIVASVISLIAKVNFFTATIFFFVIPAIYISFWHRKFIKKAMIVSAAVLPFTMVVEYMAGITKQWVFPISIFSVRLFGFIPFDVFFWYFSWIYLIVIFYEYFLEEKCTHKLSSPKLKYVFLAFLALLGLFLAEIAITGSFVTIPYFYFIWGITFGIIPIILTLLKFPNLFTKLAEATIYFSFLSFLWEMVALRLNHWAFPGIFVGWIDVFGVRFPFEEFLIWIIQGAAAILVWYEFFDDDQH